MCWLSTLHKDMLFQSPQFCYLLLWCNHKTLCKLEPLFVLVLFSFTFKLKSRECCVCFQKMINYCCSCISNTVVLFWIIHESKQEQMLKVLFSLTGKLEFSKGCVCLQQLVEYNSHAFGTYRCIQIASFKKLYHVIWNCLMKYLLTSISVFHSV